jgi:hypothetical protein
MGLAIATGGRRCRDRGATQWIPRYGGELLGRIGRPLVRGEGGHRGGEWRGRDTGEPTQRPDMWDPMPHQ